ncbi:preprotein translocase subunit YajC [Selenihalanaerobacter shriftii]|uniref:Preprotein translocase subunit YajC n=1 Tax=Selenihalanaerobacter shriftii TaxID=142842 RepID=A0A1T4MYN6_9FIRM|nr:preprotein translocase subunit YajC [Selenihalanaerobacter shriftii]SJZ72179.1 preprotein translocase subunit YajC [Selenihalanaerobacter shriftii]
MKYVINFLPWVAIFGVFWFMFIRPQKKKQQEHQDMINDLQTGDEIITISGIYGTITKITDEGFNLKIASDVEIKVVKSAIGRLADEVND